jgi:hypothetical protein
LSFLSFKIKNLSANSCVWLLTLLIMLVGISVLGIVSAGMAASLVKRGVGASTPAPTPAPTPATDSNEEVLKELAELKSMVSALQSQLAKAGG